MLQLIYIPTILDLKKAIRFNKKTQESTSDTPF